MKLFLVMSHVCREDGCACEHIMASTSEEAARLSMAVTESQYAGGDPLLTTIDYASAEEVNKLIFGDRHFILTVDTETHQGVGYGLTWTMSPVKDD